MTENDLADVKQNVMEKRLIWEKIKQDCYTWSRIRSQDNDWCVESIQAYGDWPVVDEGQVVWRDCS